MDYFVYICLSFRFKYQSVDFLDFLGPSKKQRVLHLYPGDKGSSLSIYSLIHISLFLIFAITLPTFKIFHVIVNDRQLFIHIQVILVPVFQTIYLFIESTIYLSNFCYQSTSFKILQVIVNDRQLLIPIQLVSIPVYLSIH